MDNKRLKPTTYKVRKEMTAGKEDWQYQLSSRCLYQAISDLGKAWDNFLIRLNLIGASQDLSQRKWHVRGLKLIELKSLTAS